MREDNLLRQEKVRVIKYSLNATIIKVPNGNVADF